MKRVEEILTNNYIFLIKHIHKNMQLIVILCSIYKSSNEISEKINKKNDINLNI